MRYVKVSKTERPGFPDWCPICGLDEPVDQLKLRTVAFDSTAPILSSFWPFCWIKLPGCDACDRRLKWITYRRRFALLACMAATFVFLSDMIGREVMREYKLLALAGAIGALPYILWEMQHPRPLNLVILGDGLRFDFENHDYAEEFAELNGVQAHSTLPPSGDQ